MGFLKESAPGNAKWRVLRRADDVFEVRSPENEIHGTYDSHHRAALVAQRNQRETDRTSGRTIRPCLCCQRPFESEGIHNRMCGPCRGREGESYSPYGIAPRSGRAR